MARIFKIPFATQGDKSVVPVPVQGDGSVSITQGFSFDYEREYEDPLAKDIARETMNGLLHDITEAVGDIQLTGVAKWSEDAAPYPLGALVWHDNNAWRSMVGNNSVEPTEGADWSAVMPQKTVTDALATKADTATQIIAGTGLTGGGNLSVSRTISISNSHIPIGVGQTWQDVTESRAVGVNYTNTAGRAIMVNIHSNNFTNGGTLTVDGVVVGSNNPEPAVGMTVSAIIPDGSVYSFSDSLTRWVELR